jgi:hypothetical protein
MTTTAPQVIPLSFEEALGELRSEVEELVREMPELRLEARRLITRELHFEPRPEELQAIVKLAEDKEATGLRAELPRAMLALRVLAERELNVLVGENRLDRDSIERSAAMLPGIVGEAQRLASQLSSSVESMEGLSVADRDYLLHIGEALACPEDALHVAALMAPRLSLFLKVAAGEAEARECSLSDHELEMVQGAAQGAEEGGSQPSRICINALAVRSIIEEHLYIWESTFVSEARDEVELRVREAARERMMVDRSAYQFVSDRLQKQQDMALVAGLESFVAEMREIASSLFSVNLKLVHALREGATPGDGTEPTGQEVLERFQDAELEAEKIAGTRISKEEIILNAPNKLEHEDKQPALTPRMDEPARRRRRIWVMSAIAAVLLVASAFVHLVLLEDPVETIDVSASDFNTSLDLAQVNPVGPMMQTRVLGWAELSARDRTDKVRHLGQLAAAKGFELLFVVDDNGEPAATWSEASGVELAGDRDTGQLGFIPER